MKEDGVVIKFVRERRRMTQVQLADRVGVQEPTIRRLEAGDTRVKRATWIKAAEELGLAFDLMSGRVVRPTELTDELIARLVEERHGGRGDDAAGVEGGAMMQSPTVPEWEVDVSAATWVHVPICRLDYDDPAQRSIVETGRFRLRIFGHCMEPEYQSGQVVEFQMFRIDREPLEVGADYVICRSDGLATFKRLVKNDEETISLAALNQAGYPGLLVVAKQEIVRAARVAFRMLPPPPRTLPSIEMPEPVDEQS